MFFDEIVYGTQYYRSPTPLENEWEFDMKNIRKHNINTIQVRVNWRRNEPKEGEYVFDDIDKIMDMAEENNLKVIIQFILECAPQYVFDKYNGYRIGPEGEVLRGGSHGAFYSGGWIPCFTNPEVKKAGGNFIRAFVKRYHERDSIILWNAWNEPRNRPIEECFCTHCRKDFGAKLQEKFNTIENLNNFYGVCEESFEKIALPAMPHGIWDIFEFKKYKGGRAIYNNIRFVYEAIRETDKTRPIMSHAGYTSAFQVSLSDCLDDYTALKSVDFWGTSTPMSTDMTIKSNQMDFQLLNDYLYHLDENYFMHEIYPGLGMWNEYDTQFDMDFKLYTALSSGAKGMVFWQYRSERVGHEMDCAGLARMDGSPRPVLDSVKDFGGILQGNMQEFVGAGPIKAEIAIVYDFDSQLLSEIEDSLGPDYKFELNNPIYYYRNAHMGMYRLLRNNNYAVDYVHDEDVEKFQNYKVLYIPYYTIIKEKTAKALEKFTADGGVVIADEGFGLRQENTWINPYNIKCGSLFHARMIERRKGKETYVIVDGKKLKVSPYKTVYNAENMAAFLKFDDGENAAFVSEYGKGKIYLLGFSLGYTAFENDSSDADNLLEKIIGNLHVYHYPYADVKNGLYEKRMAKDDKTIIFLFNCTEADKRVVLQKAPMKIICGEIDGNSVLLKAKSVAIVVE